MDDYVQKNKQMIELWIFYTSKLYYIITMKQIGIIIVCSTNLADWIELIDVYPQCSMYEFFTNTHSLIQM